MASDIVRAVYAPNTTQEYRTLFDAKLNELAGMNLGGGTAGGGAPSGAFNAPGNRWSNPVGGASPNIGDPSVVTWSIVPDGTTNAQTNQTSNLISFMDSIYGSSTGPVANRPWFNLIKRALR